MKIAKRGFLRYILAIVMIGALSGPAIVSAYPPPEPFQVARGTLVADRFDLKSSLLEPGEAEGASIAVTEPAVESAQSTGSPLMVALGLGLIAIALWGKKKFQKYPPRV